MGLQSNQSGGNGVFLSITNGKLVRQFKQPTDKSVKRTNKMGREVHEEFYDSLTGFISDIKTKESDYGKFWVVSVKDDKHTYFLEMKYSSGYAVSFLKALPNVSFSELVTLTPKLTIDGDKKSSVVFINQNGVGLKHFWNKANPGELPQLKQIKVKGVSTWDDTERMEYLEEYVKSNILPMIKPVLSDYNENDTPF
jgi:predicted DNA-binding transcriptional regulator AlpA